MKVGYSVEGSTDRALLLGLKERWCPDAALVEGPFRGSTHQSLRREYRKICDQFVLAGVDVMIFLTDGNGNDWRAVQQNERASFPADRLFQALHGVPDRNIECWICADADWLGHELHVDPDSLRAEDPQGVFEAAMGITRDDKQEERISALVLRAPLRSWLRNRSFEGFYDGARALSQRLGCAIENLREHGHV